MKRCYLLMFLFFFVSICASAQIQRKFFDFELGVTSKSEVASYFKDKGKEFILGDDEGDEETGGYVENIKFGGIKWAVAIFLFREEKLCVVSFSDNELKSSNQEMEKLFKDLFGVLSEKYRQYLNIPLSSEEEVVFQDEDTKIKLHNSYVNNIKSITLVYTDRKLQRESHKKVLDEF